MPSDEESRNFTDQEPRRLVDPTRRVILTRVARLNLQRVVVTLDRIAQFYTIATYSIQYRNIVACCAISCSVMSCHATSYVICHMSYVICHMS